MGEDTKQQIEENKEQYKSLCNELMQGERMGNKACKVKARAH